MKIFLRQLIMFAVALYTVALAEHLIESDKELYGTLLSALAAWVIANFLISAFDNRVKSKR